MPICRKSAGNKFKGTSNVDCQSHYAYFYWWRTFTGAAAAAVLAFGFSAGAAAADKVIRIGVTPVPHADIVNFIKPQLEKEGVKLEVVEFNDYVQPNLALDSKDLDANYFQMCSVK